MHHLIPWLNHRCRPSYPRHRHFDDPHLNDRDSYAIDQIRRQILRLLEKQPTLSLGKLAILLDLNINTLKYHIRVLQANGNLKYIGRPYHGIWVVQAPLKRR